MNYKTNEYGDVMIRDVKGNAKWVNKKLAENKILMKSMHFEVVEAPESFSIEEKTEIIPTNDFKIEVEVAETTLAKRGRKPNEK